MAGAESYVQVPADSVGKKMRTRTDTVGVNVVHNEVVTVSDPTTLTQMLAVDAAGKIGIGSSALPTGAATEASLATVAGDTTSLDGKVTACNTGAVTISGALPAGANAIGKLAANSGVDIGDVTLTAGANIVGKVGIDQTTPGTTNRVDIGAALPTGANAIGKLAANSGVDIGDVDVTSIAAGANIIGKFGIDQTTPGTTNRVDVGAALPAGANIVGKVGIDQTTPGTTNAVETKHDSKTYDHAFFNAAADGALVAAVGGKVIKVHAITIQAAGTVVVNIRSNNAAGTILASWTLEAREGAIYGFAAYPAHWFQTVQGEALFVDVTAAVNVTINCIYTDDDAS